MTHNQYGITCDKIISETMKYIDTTNMKRYEIDKNQIQSHGGAIYTSAIVSSAPISLVYTPAGSGKSSLIKDRIYALQSIGIPSSKIMVLNMNIAKVKQMSNELPDVNIMTFSDFPHHIFAANYPDCQLSDMNSIANELRLYNDSPLTNEFINKLSMVNPQDKATILTLFINNHLEDVISLLRNIHKSDYALESMICQNKIYQFTNNPYDIETIIINGVHNMPIPILCTILSYATRYNCNLFMTGSPDETIYEFNMAYANSMNALSAYSQEKQINIIRLQDTPKMNDDIKNVMLKTPMAKINGSNVQATHMIVNYDMPIQQIIQTALGYSNAYIRQKLDNNESILILARSKSDIADIRRVILDNYIPLYPHLNVVDLTTIQTTDTCYGQMASKNYSSLIIRYPNGITTGQFFYELYNIINNEMTICESPYRKTQYETDIQNMNTFVQTHMDKFISMATLFSVKDIITLLINIESDIIQSYMNTIQNEASIDMTNANIVLSTIHSATDIRNNNVIVFMKNNDDKIDDAVYRVALSRANISEYLIFANYGNFETEYQRYLKTHVQTN